MEIRDGDRLGPQGNIQSGEVDKRVTCNASLYGIDTRDGRQFRQQVLGRTFDRSEDVGQPVAFVISTASLVQ